MLDPRKEFLGNKEAVSKLRDVFGTQWFGEAVKAAQIYHHQHSENIEQIRGATKFLESLYNLTEPPMAKPVPISSGLKHDIDYARPSHDKSSIPTANPKDPVPKPRKSGS